jgi:DNA polymerase-1
LFGEIKKVEVEKVEIKAPDNTNYKLIQTKEELVWLAEQLAKAGGFVFDMETSGLDYESSDVIGISFAWKESEAYYVPVGTQIRISNFEFRNLEQGKFTAEEVGKTLKDVFENKDISKWGQNLKFDIAFIGKLGIKVLGADFDTMIASYILNPGTRSHGLDFLAFTELGHNMIPISALIGKPGKGQVSLADVPVEDVAIYSCEDADFTLRLKNIFEKKISPELKKLLSEIETPLISVLFEMEKAGILIDVKFLEKMSKDLDKKILILERKIYDLAGLTFNINSPQQVQEILFSKLGLAQKGVRKIKMGASTAAEELLKLAGLHPIVDLILQYRELFKLKSTYVDVLPTLAGKDGRIHTSFNQTITATGRLSSSNPNLQNIPIRTEFGKEIRKAFTAEKGKVLLSADYSQIELRIIAHLANDVKMKEAFWAGEDIHAATAAAVFGLDISEVTSAQRRMAKTVNFGLLYGMGVNALAGDLGIARAEAQKFIDDYFARFSGIKNYVDETLAKAREDGFVQTLFGRRRFIPEINAGHPGLRSAAERMAINMPVQGTAADIMKMAMVKIAHQNLPAKMLLTVHDELVFEVESKEVKNLAEKIKEIMENVTKLSVPLLADVKTGKNWGEMGGISL